MLREILTGSLNFVVTNILHLVSVNVICLIFLEKFSNKNWLLLIGLWLRKARKILTFFIKYVKIGF